MSKYGNLNKKYSRKQLEAIQDFKRAAASEAGSQGYRSEAETILNKVYRAFEPDPVQAAADSYLASLKTEDDNDDFSSDWASDDVERVIVAAFKTGYATGHMAN